MLKYFDNILINNELVTDKNIRKLSEDKQNLISPFDINLLQSHSYDLTLGNRFIVYHAKKSHDKFVVGVSKIEDFCDTVEADEYCLQPNDFVLGVTNQHLNLPSNLTALIEGKSTIGRLGLLIHDAGFVDAGFSGTITLEIKNLNSFPIVMKSGMKIAQVIFFEVEMPDKPYGIKGNHYQGQIDVTMPNMDRII